MRKRQRICRCLVFVTAGLAAVATARCAGPTAGDVERLFRQNRWFDLRAAVSDRTPALLRAAVATAFNANQEAEALLREIVRSQPEAADDAYELLCRIYRRAGLYTRLGETHRKWAAAFPNSPGVRRWSEDRDKFSRPDQINGARTAFVLKHSGDGYPKLPASINGIEDNFILDTGAWQSALTEKEAKKLGLTIRDEAATLVDASGTPTVFRTAVADEVVIGAMRFRNVSFAVIAPTGHFQDAELGIIGMPILLAIGTIQWSTDGTVTLGEAIPSGSVHTTPNLAFDRSRLLLSAGVLDKTVLTTLDTGANTTELNANFADTFPDVVRTAGKRGKADITGIGGSRTFDSVELPELRFTIGAKNVTIRPASVTLQRIETMGGDCCVGNAGHDLLLQGRGFSIDFSRMTLTVG
jgi:hypothetical protein